MVICSSFSAAGSPLAVPLGSIFSLVSGSEVPFAPLGAAGEMGIVSRGTGSELFAGAAEASRVVDMMRLVATKVGDVEKCLLCGRKVRVFK